MADTKMIRIQVSTHAKAKELSGSLGMDLGTVASCLMEEGLKVVKKTGKFPVGLLIGFSEGEEPVDKPPEGMLDRLAWEITQTGKPLLHSAFIRTADLKEPELSTAIDLISASGRFRKVWIGAAIAWTSRDDITDYGDGFKSKERQGVSSVHDAVLRAPVKANDMVMREIQGYALTPGDPFMIEENPVTPALEIKKAEPSAEGDTLTVGLTHE